MSPQGVHGERDGRVVGVSGRGDDEPAAGEAGAFGGGQGLPGDPVAPVVGGPVVGPAACPRGEGGHQGGEGGPQFPVLDPQGGGEGVQVPAVDGAPEAGVGRAGAGRGGGGPVGGGGLQPVALLLEGVRGQVPRTGSGSGEHRAPVHRHSAHVEFGERGEEAAGAALGAAQGADDGSVTDPGRFDGLLEPDGESGVGAALDEDVVSVGDERVDRPSELHGAAQVLVPVRGVQAQGVHGAAADRGVEGDGGRPGRGGAEQGEQFLPDLLHLGRVAGEVHPGDRPGQDALLGVPLAQPFQRRRVAGDRHRRRPVDGGDVEQSDVVGERFAYGFGGLRYEQHAASAGQGRQGPAAQGDDAGRVVQRERTGHTGGGDLPLGVADHGVGDDPVRPPQLGQRHHHGEQHGLHHVHPVQRGRVGLLAQDRERRPVQVRGEGAFTGRDPVGEGRGVVEQFPGHAGPLGPLAGEDEDGPGRPGDGALDQVGCAVAGGQRRQATQQGRTVVTDDGRAVLEGGPGGGQRMADVGGRQLRMIRQIRVQPLRLGLDRLGGPPGQDPRDGGARGARGLLAGLGGEFGHRRGRRRGRRKCGLGGRLLDDDMGVGAAEAERGHPGPARPAGLRPGCGLGQQFDGARRPVDVRGRPVDVQGPGQLAVRHGQHHLDDAADPSGGLGVADVRLQRPQPQREVGGPVLTVRGQQRVGLDRITQPGTGAVRLYGVHVGGRQPGVGQRVADHPLLGQAAGRGQPVARAVLVDGRAAQHREHRVAVAAGVRKAFQDQQAHALGHAEAVGRCSEGPAAPVLGEPPLPAEAGERQRGAHHRGAARQSQLALARAQRPRGEVDRHQGRGAGRVHGHGGPLEAELVGDPAGQDAGGDARDEQALQLFGDLAQGAAVSLVGGPGEDPGRGALQGRRVDTGALDRLPGRFEQQPLLRVHGQGLTRGDPEEGRVEPVSVPDESACGGVAPAGPVGVRVVQRFEVPAPVGRQPGDGVASVRDQVPQVLGRAYATGVAAAHGDDHDGVVVLSGGHGRELPGGGGLLGGAQQSGLQVPGERGGRGVVEDDGDREPQAGGGVEPVAHVHGGQ